MFAGLLLLLVCVLIGQPYRLARDNRLDVVCIVVLLFSYFASGARWRPARVRACSPRDAPCAVLVGVSPSVGVEASVLVAQALLVLYAVFRIVQSAARRVMEGVSESTPELGALNDPVSRSLPFMDGRQGAEAQPLRTPLLPQEVGPTAWDASSDTDGAP